MLLLSSCCVLSVCGPTQLIPPPTVLESKHAQTQKEVRHIKADQQGRGEQLYLGMARNNRAFSKDSLNMRGTLKMLNVDTYFMTWFPHVRQHVYLLRIIFDINSAHTRTHLVQGACISPSMADYVSLFPFRQQKPLLCPVTQGLLNLSQYVNTVMQLLCKEICEEKALPEWRDYPAGGLKG